MKRFFLILVLISIATVYSQENKGLFEIYGKIEGVKRGKIKLGIIGDKPVNAKVKDGKFYMKGKIKHTSRANFMYKNIPSSSFYLDNSTIHLRLRIMEQEEYNGTIITDKDTIKVPYRPVYVPEYMQGNAVEDEYQNYLMFSREHNEAPNFNRLVFDYLEEKIKERPDNYLYFDILFSLALSNNSLTPNQILKLAVGLDLSYIDFDTKKRFVEVLQNNRK